MSTFEIRVGDQEPVLAYRLGIDLTTATSVTFSARDKTTTEVFIDDAAGSVANGIYRINGVQTTLTPADGVLIYDWAPADVAVARASCECLFHVYWSGGEMETFPSTGFIRLVIRENF